MKAGINILLHFHMSFELSYTCFFLLKGINDHNYRHKSILINFLMIRDHEQ